MANKYSRNNCGPDPESIPEQAEELEDMYEIVDNNILQALLIAREENEDE